MVLMVSFVMAAFDSGWQLYKHRPDSPLSHLKARYAGDWLTKPVKAGLPMLAVAIVLLPYFSKMKSAIPLFNDYTWEGFVMGMGFEIVDDDNDIFAYWPGLDCAVNCHIALPNVGRAFPKQTLSNDDGPSRGAMTPFRAGTTWLLADVPAGGELFKDYGDQCKLLNEQYCLT